MTRRARITRRAGVTMAVEVMAEDATEVALEWEDVMAAGTMATNTAQVWAVTALADATAVAEDATEYVTELKDVMEESM